MSFLPQFEGLINVGIDSVIPFSLIQKNIIAGQNEITVCGKKFKYMGKINVFGFGKAALGLVKETVNILGQRIDRVVCCTPEPNQNEIRDFPRLFSTSDIKPMHQVKPKVNIFNGLRTNEPNDDVIRSSLLMAQIASEMGKEDLLLVCITGGGSAMLTLPCPITKDGNPLDTKVKRIPLEDIIETSRLLSLGGASIQEINSVRSCLDAMKAGGLARFASPSQVVSLILSDVIGNPLEFIASGPTYIKDDAITIDPVTRARSILEKYEIESKIPERVMKFFEAITRGVVDEPVENLPVNFIIGNITLALTEVSKAASMFLPGDRQIKPTSIPKYFLPRTPVDTFKCLLPILLTDSLCGDMGQKAEAVADLALNLRSLIQMGIGQPNFDVHLVDSQMIEDIKKNHDHLLYPTKFDFNDLIYCCFEITKMIHQLPEASRKSSDLLGGLCLIFGGEATVKINQSKSVSMKPKRGGRCSHAALTASLHWYQRRLAYTETIHCPLPVDIGFFARASDGLDGPSAYGAGAWGALDLIDDEETAQMAQECLENGDSYRFYSQAQKKNAYGSEQLYVPARLTGTNVMDLFMCMINVYGENIA